MAHIKCGDARLAQGAVAEALSSYHAAHDILQCLARIDLSHVGRQRDLSVSYAKLTAAYLSADDVDKARDALVAGRAIIASLLKSIQSGWSGNKSCAGSMPGWKSYVDEFGDRRFAQPAIAIEADVARKRP